jgi:hypothetical protein
MYINVGKRRKDNDLIVVLASTLLAIIPLLPLIGFWKWLNPVSFWQKIALLAIYFIVIYPAAVALELLIIGWLD